MEVGIADTKQVLALGWTPPGRRFPRGWHDYLRGSERTWAMAFVVPYLAVLLVFAVYPVAYGLWMASAPSLYANLFASDEYGDALVTTLLYVGIGVNITMFLSLLLSGFFMRRRWWIKGLLVLSMLPWALPAQPAFISIHWMLIYPGYIDALCWHLFGFDGPDWFNNYWSALGSNILASTWKTMPFWTLILLAGRMAIPQDLYDAAAIDGASGFQRFSRLVVPLLANLYLACTLLAALWMIGDFVTPDMVSSGAPDGSTDVLATFGVDSMLEAGKPALGIAAAMSSLPLLIPLAVALMRTLQTREVQL
jgi:multiple sugar transport system permease protein